MRVFSSRLAVLTSALSLGLGAGCCRRTATNIDERVRVVEAGAHDHVLEVDSLRADFDRIAGGVTPSTMTSPSLRERELELKVAELQQLLEARRVPEIVTVAYPQVPIEAGRPFDPVAPAVVPESAAATLRFQVDPSAPLPDFANLDPRTGVIYPSLTARPTGQAVSARVAVSVGSATIVFARIEFVPR